MPIAGVHGERPTPEAAGRPAVASGRAARGSTGRGCRGRHPGPGPALRGREDGIPYRGYGRPAHVRAAADDAVGGVGRRLGVRARRWSTVGPCVGRSAPSLWGGTTGHCDRTPRGGGARCASEVYAMTGSVVAPMRQQSPNVCSEPHGQGPARPSGPRCGHSHDWIATSQSPLPIPCRAACLGASFVARSWARNSPFCSRSSASVAPSEPPAVTAPARRS